MASNINTTTINTAYPVAGQDNDSQGFRDNFTNINSNFVEAKSEIEDIQSKGIFKSALVGAGSLDNDMQGSVISSAKLTDVRETVVVHNSIENPLKISIKAGAYHTVTPNASFTIAFDNGTGAHDWPATGSYSRVRLEVTIDNIAKTITLPAEVSVGLVPGQSGQVITVQTPGTYVYEFSTRDGGTTVSITAVTAPALPEIRTVASSVGAAGDVAGMSGFDSNYIYVCTADYDGVSNIWQRVAVTGGAW